MVRTFPANRVNPYVFSKREPYAYEDLNSGRPGHTGRAVRGSLTPRPYAPSSPTPINSADLPYDVGPVYRVNS